MFVVRIVSKVLVISFAKQTSRSLPNTKSISASVVDIRFGDSYTMWNINWGMIDVPVFNITGLQDQIFRNDKVITEMLTQFQNIKSIEYKDAGHMIPVETPEQLAKDILKFIERL